MNSQEEAAVAQLEVRYRAVSLRPSNFVPSRLYHYTSAVGFFGIVSTGVLRGSNFRYMNDSAEIQYGRDLAREAICCRLVQEATTPSPQKTALLKHVFTALQDIGTRIEFYLACFCTEPDLLSQWRGYGSSRGRFCIGFDTEDLPTGPEYILSGVVYDQSKQRQEIDRAVHHALDALAAGSAEDFVQGLGSALTAKLERELCFFKHPGFVEEREWRVVHAGQPEDAVGFDIANGLLRPLVDLWFGSDQGNGLRKLPIAEVVVGAAGPVAHSIRSAELLLARYGYSNVEIRQSAVPYREL